MTARIARLLLVVLLTTLTSGAPQVLATALDDDCCAEPCAGALDGKHCPPNCDKGVCAKVHASVAPVVTASPGPAHAMVRAVVLAQVSPRLPMVIASVFHPPIA